MGTDNKIPTGSLLESNKNLANLKTKIGSDPNNIYCYIITSIENRKNYFYQTGSAPNFEGGLITLCTCKRYMRTFKDPETWKGKWIAGFSSIGDGSEVKGKRYQALVYLMKIGLAFDSQESLWQDDKISKETKKEKTACEHRLGDFFEPRGQGGDPFVPESYFDPCPDHDHNKNETKDWHKDINYISRWGRHPALLVGDPKYSFLWDKPMIYYSNDLQLRNGQKKFNNFQSLCTQLSEVE